MNKKLKLEKLNRLSVLEFKEAEKDPIIVLLDDVRSLNNIGSVFRTCDAMGIKKIHIMHFLNNFYRKYVHTDLKNDQLDL